MLTRKHIAILSFSFVSILMLSIMAILIFVVPHFFPWTRFNCQNQDVDIKTGKLRFTRYILFCKITEKVTDSPVSKVLPPECLSGVKPEWYAVNTFSPGIKYSPRYIFHRAIHQMYELKNLWEMAEGEGVAISNEIKQRTAIHLLALWQYSGDDYLAGFYILGLHDLLRENKRQKVLQSLPTLVMPLTETNGSVIVQTVFFPNGQPLERVHGYYDSSQRLIRHGNWERWWSDGTRKCVASYINGKCHGPLFQWQDSGELFAIDTFNHGDFIHGQFKNLEKHPDYLLAIQLQGQSVSDQSQQQ